MARRTASLVTAGKRVAIMVAGIKPPRPGVRRDGQKTRRRRSNRVAKDAEESGSTAMRSFAAGFRKDHDARYGLDSRKSGATAVYVEGFIHKLKLLKRQGYGRAGFELLRARMLAT